MFPLAKTKPMMKWSLVEGRDLSAASKKGLKGFLSIKEY